VKRCLKEAWPTPGAAHAALELQQKLWARRIRHSPRSRTKGDHPPRRVYRCGDCKLYHLTGTEGSTRG
jgi:hypothetical protein